MTSEHVNPEDPHRPEDRQAELQRLIRRSALEWRLTFDALAFPLLLVELDGRILRMNEAARQLGGVSYEAAIHHPLAVLGDGEPWRSVHILLLEVAATGRQPGLQPRGEDGRTWDVSISLAAGPDRERWAVVVIHDITDTVRLQESLRRSETMSAMGALVAGVAHEVRNPLFAISAILDTFEAKLKRRTELRRHLDVLRERVQRLKELMQHLLDYGKPSRLDFVEVRPREVMEAAAGACAPLAGSGEVAIEIEAEPDLAPFRADRGRVIQVFENLLDNAIRHSPPGGAVRFRARPGADGVLFSVEDGGPGFRPEDLDRLFEPFFSRRRGGTGLGLSIVQRIAEEHGGRVEAANRAGGGAVMTVTLPASAAYEARLKSRRLPPPAFPPAPP